MRIFGEQDAIRDVQKIYLIPDKNPPWEWAIPENIQTYTTDGFLEFRGQGGFLELEFRRHGGVL